MRFRITPIAISITFIFIVGVSFFAFSPAMLTRNARSNTDYGQRYAEDKFEIIQIGMSANSVYKLIGDPIKRTTASVYPVWALSEMKVREHYGKSNEIEIEVLYYSWPKNLQRDFEMIQICLGPGKEVIEKTRRITD